MRNGNNYWSIGEKTLSPSEQCIAMHLKTERERKRGRELLLDKYLLMGCNEA